ncbi:MAG: hypothetical protein JO244_09365 [Solirubrobacterales bacterium]|nr:hypothetical protein [Solirubrobacterales bacterium]
MSHPRVGRSQLELSKVPRPFTERGARGADRLRANTRVRSTLPMTT